MVLFGQNELVENIHSEWYHFGRMYKNRYCLKENISTDNNTKLKIVLFFILWTAVWRFTSNQTYQIIYDCSNDALMGIFN